MRSVDRPSGGGDNLGTYVPFSLHGSGLRFALHETGPDALQWLFVFANALFYGCAVHAAGFFMPRGMKLFGGGIIGTTGAALWAMAWFDPTPDWNPHLLMGALFGVLHLAYGVYLHVTEPRERAA